MEEIVGFIGTGNMGGALARAAAREMQPQAIVLANRTAAKAQALAAELGCRWGTNEAAARESALLFLGVKPQMMEEMLAEIAPVLAARQTPATLVTMAAGLTMARIQEMAGAAYPVIRIMPNTPVLVERGMILYDHTDNVSPEALNLFRAALARAGRLDPLPERLIDAGSAVSGCGPAFVDLFLEALADGGVLCGLPRDKAMLYAAQMVLGAAALTLETAQHPGPLKDAVCSPGGSTIVGVQTLERRAFRSTVIDAVEAAYHKTQALG